mgnify:CR=1 FL=1
MTADSQLFDVTMEKGSEDSRPTEMSVSLSGGDRVPQGTDGESPDTTGSVPHSIDFLPTLFGLPSWVGYEEEPAMPE